MAFKCLSEVEVVENNLGLNIFAATSDQPELWSIDIDIVDRSSHSNLGPRLGLEESPLLAAATLLCRLLCLCKLLGLL